MHLRIFSHALQADALLCPEPAATPALAVFKLSECSGGFLLALNADTETQTKEAAERQKQHRAPIHSDGICL